MHGTGGGLHAQNLCHGAGQPAPRYEMKKKIYPIYLYLKIILISTNFFPPGSSLCFAAVPAMYRAKARLREVDEVEEGEVVEEQEVLEIYTSFRPETTTYITADRLEQVCQTAVINFTFSL